jgi:hypothetical protein
VRGRGRSMSCRFLVVHREEDVVVAGQVSQVPAFEVPHDPTFESTNLLMVAIMSLCPSTSSSEFGRYFSTLHSVSNCCDIVNSVTYHGNESSASTGKFAALHLPFFWSPPKLIEVSATGASTSISSSKSDILDGVAVHNRLQRYQWCFAFDQAEQ